MTLAECFLEKYPEIFNSSDHQIREIKSIKFNHKHDERAPEFVAVAVLGLDFEGCLERKFCSLMHTIEWH